MTEFHQLASMAISDIRRTPRGLSSVPVQRTTPQEPRLFLTAEEAIQVDLSTVRESASPRYWPADALIALLDLK